MGPRFFDTRDHPESRRPTRTSSDSLLRPMVSEVSSRPESASHPAPPAIPAPGLARLEPAMPKLRLAVPLDSIQVTDLTRIENQINSPPAKPFRIRYPAERCRCGRSDHARITFHSCPLNPARLRASKALASKAQSTTDQLAPIENSSQPSGEGKRSKRSQAGDGEEDDVKAPAVEAHGDETE